MADATECTVRDGKFVQPCGPLAECCDGANPVGKAKGIFAWAWSTWEGPSRTMYGIRGGQHPGGMVFNFCPFCGNDISAPFKAKERP